MNAFADSSALVKLYADEPGCEDIRRISLIIVSQLARVEVPAAIWRKQRMQELDATQAADLVTQFEIDYFGTDEKSPRFSIVAASANVLDSAARLAAVHGLRAYDAVQLASACAVGASDSGAASLAAFDSNLRAAAAAEGLELVPSETVLDP